LFLTAIFLAFETGFTWSKNKAYKPYNYTQLPNSCFLESLIYSSRASLVLKTETTPRVYSSIFGYIFRYKEDIKIDGKDSSMVFGHAVCIFEYKNKLWAYDMNYGTMPVGNASKRSNYNERLKEWAEKTYEIKIEKCFVVDDWGALPPDFVKLKKE